MPEPLLFKRPEDNNINTSPRNDESILEQQSQDPLWKRLARAILVDVPAGVTEGLLGKDPNAERRDTSDWANLIAQGLGTGKVLAEAGLPFAAYKSILPKGNVFHGTQRLFDQFDPTKYDKSDTLGWMTHFAEDPGYAGQYAMGVTKGVKPVSTSPILYNYNTYDPKMGDKLSDIDWHASDRNIKGVNPHIIPANIEAKNVLDLVNPNPDDISAALAALDPNVRKQTIRNFKTVKQGIRDVTKAGLDPQLAQSDFLSSAHYPDPVDPKEIPIRALADQLRLTPSEFQKTPFDAIRYRDVGNKSWAVPEGTPIKSIFGASLTNDPNPIKMIPSHDPNVGTQNIYHPSTVEPTVEKSTADKLFDELKKALEYVND